MIGSGKYNFPGIRKAGAAGLKAALASTVWGAKIIASPFNKTIDFILEWLSEFLANKGLVIINVGSFYINGEFDQRAFDKAMENGLNQVKNNPNLTEKQKEAIDNEVKKAFRNSVYYSKP